jgi:hypothetical protein
MINKHLRDLDLYIMTVSKLCPIIILFVWHMITSVQKVL